LLSLIVFVLLASSAAPGQKPNATRGPGDPRQTPAVEIFQRYKDCVIYLTGPTIRGKGQLVEEFFEVPRKQEVMSLGSGFIIHESGYVLTNVHTVEKVITYFITLGDGTVCPANLLATAREHDIALLKINVNRPLTAVKLARSNDVVIGEPVIVIGNPFGLPLTCSVGVVSALDRATQPSGLPGVTLQGMIQTDASINVGSSGGPWFNALGEVIAMTVAKRLNSDNIAFGAPVATIRESLPDLLDVERRGGIVTGVELDAAEPPRVVKVLNGLPAAAAGVLPGDLVASVNGKPIQDHPDFCFALMGRKPTETIQLGLIRDDKPVAAALKLGARAKLDGAALLKRFGLTAIPLDDAKAQATSMRVRRGVVITDVAKGPPWDYEKLEAPPIPGDVLARIDGIRPQNLEDVGLILDRVKLGQSVNMVFLRRNGDLDTRIDLKTGLSPRDNASRPQNPPSRAAESPQGEVVPQSRVLPRKDNRLPAVTQEPRSVLPQGGVQRPEDLPQPSS